MALNLSIYDRYKIIFYHQGLNGPKNSISQIASHLNCDKKTVKKWIKRFEETGDVLDQPHTGRNFKTTQIQDKKILSIAKSANRPSTRAISRMMKDKGVQISHRSIQARLHRAGLKYMHPLYKPLLKSQQCINRLEWAKNHQDFDWSFCLFTDEVTFSLFDYRNMSWQNPDEREIQRKVKHPQKVHAWGCFSINGFGKLFLFEGNLNSDLMIGIYEQALLPSISMCFDSRTKDWILQEDNDPKHRSTKSMNWKERNQINVIPWPACSPDLNPIENVWAVMKYKISEKKPTTINKLKQEINKIWEGFQSDYAENLVRSMENRITSCILSHGDFISY